MLNQMGPISASLDGADKAELNDVHFSYTTRERGGG